MKSVMEEFFSEATGSGYSAPVSSGNFAAVASAATDHSRCDTDGHLLMAGCNDWDNATSKSPQGLDGPHKIVLDRPVVDAFSSSSSMHEFVLAADGSLFAVGRNDHGQLGTGDNVTRTTPVLVNLKHSSRIKKVSTGRSHSLILFEDGEVWGAGASNFGQIGMGNSKLAMRDALHFVKVPFPDSLISATDIACGYDFSLICCVHGCVFSSGHPEYGVLGHGTNGEFIKDGGKGAAVQYSCEYTLKKIESFVTKDSHNKIVNVLPASAVHIRAVAAGKNHALCLEDWENCNDICNDKDVAPRSNMNRVFSWGWGGYGRLGHNGAHDEYIPREIVSFSHFVNIPCSSGSKETIQTVQRVQVSPVNKQKQVREIYCGSSFSLAISESRHLHYFGKMSNAPRGEATVYPQIQQELFDHPVRRCAVGSNLVVVITGKNNRASSLNGATDGPSVAIAWGVPVSGKLGFDGDSRTSTVPKVLSKYEGFDLRAVSCGYGHVSFVAADETRFVTELPVVAGASVPSSITSGKKKKASTDASNVLPTKKSAKK
jgi:alpha-tubulin suppressor-like RCC1 family protein